MEQSNKNKTHILRKTFLAVQDWIMDHTKIVMPIVLIVCVLITVLIAINANQKEALEKEAELAAAAVSEQQSSSETESISAPVFTLEENAYPDVNNVIKTYYEAQASGDVDMISELNPYLNDIEKIRVEELSKYIEEARFTAISRS